MAEFDPDAYLAGDSKPPPAPAAAKGEEFDPDAYLVTEGVQKPVEGRTWARKILGASLLGAGPKVVGFGEALAQKLGGHTEYADGDFLPSQGPAPEGSFGEIYEREKAKERASQENLTEQHPRLGLAADIGGSLPLAALPLGAAKNAVGYGSKILAGLKGGAVAGAALGGVGGLASGEGDLAERAASVGKGIAGGAAGGAALGGAGAAVAPVLRPIGALASKAAGSLGEALERLGISTGRRFLGGGANPLAVKKPISADAVRAAFEEGAIRPFKNTQGAAEVLGAARERVGDQYGDIVGKLEQAGVKGPNIGDLVENLRMKGGTEAENTLGSGTPELYARLADELAAKGGGEEAQLGLRQAENLKRSAQAKAKYDKVQGDTQMEGARKDVAATFREAVERVIDRAAKSNPELKDLAGQFGPVKRHLGNLIEASEAAEKGAAQAARRNAFSLRDTAVGAAELAAGSPSGAATAVGASKLLRTYGTPTLASGAYKAGRGLQSLSKMGGSDFDRAILKVLGPQAGRQPQTRSDLHPALAGANTGEDEETR